MIIARTPLRMSFVGGGSDLPSYYRQFGGAVVSTAIDKFVYVTVNEKFDNGTRVSYSKTEEVETVDQIEHPIVRETMKTLGIRGGVEITSVADIPSKGTGLGSSSAFTVALLHSLNAYKAKFVSAEYLASESYRVEVDLCGAPIGKQDQYASAYGGMNFIRFNEDDSVYVDPIICRRETINQLERNTLVFYTGMTRSANSVLADQSAALNNDKAKQEAMRSMVRLAYVLRDELQKNNLESFGEILHENWILKRSMTSGVSNNSIDEWYETARSAGASGGKLLGAGAGGFLMFYAPSEIHDRIQKALPGLRRVNFGYAREGSKIVFVS